MDLLVSNQLHGSLRLIRFRKHHYELSITLRNEIFMEGSDKYVQKVKLLKFRNMSYLVIARKNGLIQLYESISSVKRRTFKLFKEWKNSNMSNQDSIESLGLINNQYLYSCSNEGKLIIRDLVNDDEDESYKVYLINSPVSSIDVRYFAKSSKILVASAGKNNELKLYEIDMSGDGGCKHSCTKSPTETSNERSTIRSREEPLRRRRTSLNLRASNDRQVNTLIPFWIASSYFGDYVYKSISCETISNWIVSICFVNAVNKELILCGTQFGKLLVYNIMDESYPVKVLPLSHFPINNLKVFNDNQLLIFSDSMSKIGIMKIPTFEIINFYDNLKIGPTISIEIVVGNNPNRKKRDKESWLSPIYVVCSNITNDLLIYKLCHDNSYSLVTFLQLPYMMPCLALLTEDSYKSLEDLFGDHEVQEESQQAFKRRKLISLDSFYSPKDTSNYVINPHESTESLKSNECSNEGKMQDFCN